MPLIHHWISLMGRSIGRSPDDPPSENALIVALRALKCGADSLGASVKPICATGTIVMASFTDSSQWALSGQQG